MYTEYAKDPRMKRNIGIGRRLATLVDNDRRVAELLHSLLFSLPGSPVLYYGDEIGMGDNIYLGDRDGVRTPMQWSPDRNAGFSRADFAQLYLPPLMDPVYGFQAVNVEAQMRNPSSLLHWMRRMLEVRRQHPVFGTGDVEIVSTDNPSVLAYIRVPTSEEAPPRPRAGKAGPSKASAGQLRTATPGPVKPSPAMPSPAVPSPVMPGPAMSSPAKPSPDITTAPGDAVLCVSNLSRFAQPAQLPLQRWEGMTPIELLGRTPFPPIGELPYFVTLPPYGFYWFGLVTGAPSPTGD